jgi:hypothetical protein
LRIYYGTWPLTGRHRNRPPVLQPDPDLQEPDVLGGTSCFSPTAAASRWSSTGKLASARIYDDADPPLGSEQ